jgi:hypothetical protein
MLHVSVLSVAFHAMTSDRMLDAYADVGMDKVATVAMRAIGGVEK